MEPREKPVISAFLTLVSVCTFVIIAVADRYEDSPLSSLPLTSRWVGNLSRMGFPETKPIMKTLEERVAYRLKGRLRLRGLPAPAVSILSDAILKRQALLRQSLTVSFLRPDGGEQTTWFAGPQRYPLWLKGEFSLTKAQFSIDETQVAKELREEVVDIPFPVDIVLTEVEQQGEVMRAQTSGTAESGLDFDGETTAEAVSTALMQGESDLKVHLTNRQGRILNTTNVDLGDLTLLASGRSNFRGSTPSRVWNIQKALSEHVNNVIVPPGATFSFNSTLRGPVSLRNGWHMAKIILNGDVLVDAPGGGICQASTTVYRAAVNAGLPVLDRRSHSLYVTYYEKYGVGIDATIYPGTQDLTFANDSPGALLIQAYVDGNDAFVSIFGTNDGRTVALEGPYLAGSAPKDLRINGREIQSNEIAWVQRVTYHDGSVEENTIVSRYKSLPLRVRQEYAMATIDS